MVFSPRLSLPGAFSEKADWAYRSLLATPEIQRESFMRVYAAYMAHTITEKPELMWFFQWEEWSRAPKTTAEKDTRIKDMSTGLRHLMLNKEYKGALSLFSPPSEVRKLMVATGILDEKRGRLLDQFDSDTLPKVCSLQELSFQELSFRYPFCLKYL